MTPKEVVRAYVEAFGREPTGRSYELVAMEWFRIENGRIQRRWGARDADSQARQQGIPVEQAMGKAPGARGTDQKRQTQGMSVAWCSGA